MSEAPDSMLSAVTRALASPGAPPADLPLLDDAVIRQVEPDAELVLLFVDRAEAAGAAVRRVGADKLAEAVAEILAGCAAELILCHREVVNTWPALAEFFARAGRPPELADRAIFEAEAGVTLAEWGIAETGSIVCTSGAGRSRQASLVPPLHLALLDARRIVPDLLDFFAAAAAEPLPANVNLITGPSKTADIEGILVTGMHGPGRLQVVVVEPD